MKLLILLFVLSLFTLTWSFRFGTMYNAQGNYIGPSLDDELQPPKYSYDNPYASSSNLDYRRKYFSQSPDHNAPIIKYVNQQSSDGNYNYEYETGNQIRVEQTGHNHNGENVVRGSYSYVGPDGVTYTTHYIADKNGYRAYGSHLPKQPHEVIEESRTLQQSQQRFDVIPDREYYASTSRPQYVSITQKASSFLPPISSTPYSYIHKTVSFPANSIPSLSTFLSPPFKTYPSAISPSIESTSYSTTNRPYYSTSTGKSF